MVLSSLRGLNGAWMVKTKPSVSAERQQGRSFLRTAALFVSARWGGCLFFISLCVIWVGRSTEKHTSKQNSYVSWFSAYLSFFSLFSSLFPAPQTPPCLSQSACGSAPAAPGKSWLRYPRKTSLSEERGMGEGSRELLTQRIYSTFGVFFKKKNACVKRYFFFQQSHLWILLQDFAGKKREPCGVVSNKG